jgi:pimeloyl-ACP methyl ester carboxylesterase
LGLLAALVVILVAVFVYTRVKENQALSDMPADSMLIDIGGRTVHMRAMGTEHDGPAVVLIPGFGGLFTDSGLWSAVQPQLAETVTVYAFDFPGYAWSDPNPEPVSHINAADDLHAALETLDEEAIILVGFATGSNTTLAYYDRYPDNPTVLGIIWLDADALVPDVIDYYKDITSSADSYRPLIEPGLVSLFYDLIVLPKKRTEVQDNLATDAPMDWAYYDQIDATRSTRKVLRALFDLNNSYISDLDYAAGLDLPVDIPVFAVQTDMLRLQTERYPEEKAEINAKRGPLMTAWFQEVAERSAGGQHIFLADRDHLVMLEDPQAVIDIVVEMVDLVKDDA